MSHSSNLTTPEPAAAAASVTSLIASEARCLLREIIVTEAPAAAHIRAADLPRPALAPVMMTSLPSALGSGSKALDLAA